jgi:hypothetical protein
VSKRVDNPKARMHRVVCRSRPIPEGWVVIGEHNSPACDGDGANALVIKRPGRREVVTAGSPVPDGYRRVRRAELDGDAEEGWVIERDD